MRPKSFFLALITLLVCVVLSSCSLDDPMSANADPPLRVTPYNTYSGSLAATIQINEDQDAVDRLSNITLQMRFDAIEEDNYVHFHHNEYAVCNGVKQKMDDSPQYSFKIDPGGYECSYIGFTPNIGLLFNDPVTIFSITGRSRLHPQILSFSSQSYTIQYTPDPGSLACPITAVASDNSGDSATGGISSSDSGLYEGPITSSLTGKGEIVLKRTCTWRWGPSNLAFCPNNNDQYVNEFCRVDVTYQSSASVEVTWSH